MDLAQALEKLSGEVFAAVMGALDENHFVKMEVKMREVVLLNEGEVRTYDLAEVEDPMSAEVCWLKVHLKFYFTRPVSEREIRRAQKLLEMLFEYPKVWREKEALVVEIPVRDCIEGLLAMYEGGDLTTLWTLIN